MAQPCFLSVGKEQSFAHSYSANPPSDDRWFWDIRANLTSINQTAHDDYSMKDYNSPQYPTNVQLNLTPSSHSVNQEKLFLNQTQIEINHSKLSECPWKPDPPATRKCSGKQSENKVGEEWDDNNPRSFQRYFQRIYSNYASLGALLEANYPIGFFCSGLRYALMLLCFRITIHPQCSCLRFPASSWFLRAF